MRTKGVFGGLALFGAVLISGDRSSAELVYPSGAEGFESLTVGDSVSMLGWIVVNTSNPDKKFSVQAVDDPGPRPGSSSTRWLRIVDADSANVQNRFYSPEILNGGANENYAWTFHVKLEDIPGDGPVFPRFTIQHFNGVFGNAWGIEFRPTGVNLIVTGIGGTAGSRPLYSYGVGTEIGTWVKLQLGADFTIGHAWASVNDGPSVSLPTNLTGDRNFYRFCFRGEGTGNTSRMLLDDVSVNVTPFESIPAVGTWGLVVLALLILILAKSRWMRRDEDRLVTVGV